MFGTIDWGQAVLIFVLGMGTVFAVLILLWAILKLMKVVFYREPQAAPVPQQAAPVPAEPSVSETATGNDDELIAVLTAAIACSLQTSTYNLKIRSYRKLGGPESVWNSVSRRENIENQL